MDQVQESYDEFNLNFRIEDTVIVNQTEMEGFNAFFLGNQSTCQQSVVEGVRVLSYKIPATLPLGQFLKKQLYKGEFLSILSNILNQLLYFEDQQTLNYRAMNLIEKNIRLWSENPGLRMDSMAQKMKITVCYEARPLFLRLVTIGDISDEAYQFTYEKKISYLDSR